MAIIDNYFDLKELFVNELIGNVMLFVILSMILIIFFSAKYKFPLIAKLIIMIVWVFILNAEYGLTSIYTIMGVVIGLLIYGIFSKGLR